MFVITSAYTGITPTTKTQTSTCGGPWIGGILIGMISGILVMVMVWVIVTLIRKKIGKKVNNLQRYHNRYDGIFILSKYLFLFSLYTAVLHHMIELWNV